MLEFLGFHQVGPARDLEVTFSRRLNFVTGDNGLGKTFLLDVAWWALTRTWAGQTVVPRRPPAVPTISYRYGTKTNKTSAHTSTFDRETEKWSVKPVRPSIPGLVLYAQVDGGFSVWDPARNYWKKENPERPASYTFTAKEIWDGNEWCEGIVRDWASWQLEDGDAFAQLKGVLKSLSPSMQESLKPGALRKISLSDPRKHPTLQMPYGEEVALVHASAGMRRVVVLAYLLVWTWQEHLEACELRGEAPAQEVIFLIDEIEAHLHPQWQRRVVPALLHVMEALTGDHNVKVQIITATHSPLVLASVEPIFDPAQDALFLLDLSSDRTVTLNALPWSKQGDVVNWLVSDAFGLEQGRSLEAELAIEAAEAWMRDERTGLPNGLDSQDAIDKQLKNVLAGHDAFWPRWVVWVETSAEDKP